MISLIFEDNFNAIDAPIGTTFEGFPTSMRTHGRSFLSDEERKLVRNTVSNFIKYARDGQIWKTSGGFGSSGNTFEIVKHRNGLGLRWTNSNRTYELNRKNVEEFIFQGVTLIEYREEEKVEEENEDKFSAIADAFTELGYKMSESSDDQCGEFTTNIQDKSNDHIIYDVTIYTGLVFSVEITVWDDGMNIGEYRLPTRGRKPIGYIATADDVYKADSVLRNLSTDILHKKWEAK